MLKARQHNLLSPHVLSGVANSAYRTDAGSEAFVLAEIVTTIVYASHSFARKERTSTSQNLVGWRCHWAKAPGDQKEPGERSRRLHGCCNL